MKPAEADQKTSKQWVKVLCAKCNLRGHSAKNCYTRKIWRPKQKQAVVSDLIQKSGPARSETVSILANPEIIQVPMNMFFAQPDSVIQPAHSLDLVPFYPATEILQAPMKLSLIHTCSLEFPAAVQSDHLASDEESDEETQQLHLSLDSDMSALGFVAEADTVVTCQVALDKANAENYPQDVVSLNDPEQLSEEPVMLPAVGKLQVEVGPSAPARPRGRPRGRPRKVPTPKVESEVRRSTRQNNDGVLYELPNASSRRRASSVPRTAPPATLQIQVMQRMGVEQCLIDPAELTEDRLLQKR
jgi:hypothetical protein